MTLILSFSTISQLNLKSWEVTATPSDHLRPGRRRNVTIMVLLVSLTFHSPFAIDGTSRAIDGYRAQLGVCMTSWSIMLAVTTYEAVINVSKGLNKESGFSVRAMLRLPPCLGGKSDI